MLVSRRPKVAAVAAAVVMLPLLAACSSTGFSAQTGQIYIPAAGANARGGAVDVLNAVVVSGQDGAGTLVATFVDTNQTTADSLQSIAGTGLTITPSSGVLPAALPVGGHLNLADVAPITVAGADVKAGNFITVVFDFAIGAPVTLTIPVVAPTGEFASIPLPTPTATQ